MRLIRSSVGSATDHEGDDDMDTDGDGNEGEGTLQLSGSEVHAALKMLVSLVSRVSQVTAVTWSQRRSARRVQ